MTDVMVERGVVRRLARVFARSRGCGGGGQVKGVAAEELMATVLVQVVAEEVSVRAVARAHGLSHATLARWVAEFRRWLEVEVVEIGRALAGEDEIHHGDAEARREAVSL